MPVTSRKKLFHSKQTELRIMLLHVITIEIFFLFSSLQVATFILQKILLDELGLSYICQTYERFSHVAMILVSTQINSLYCILVSTGRVSGTDDVYLIIYLSLT